MHAFNTITSAAFGLTLATPALAEMQEQKVSLTAAPALSTEDTELAAIRIVTIDVASAAQLVADKHGLSVQVSEAVRGQLSNLVLTGDAGQMMTLIGTEADISWFVYSGTLQVSAKGEDQTRFIPIGELSAEFVDKALAASELDPGRLNLLHMPDSGAVRVSGPPKAVEIVEAVLSLAEEDAPVAVSDGIVVRRGIAKSLEIYGEAAAPELANAPAPQAVALEEPASSHAETTQTEDGDTEQGDGES